MAYWKHATMTKGWITVAPRKNAPIVGGYFEAPDDGSLELKLRENGHTRMPSAFTPPTPLQPEPSRMNYYVDREERKRARAERIQARREAAAERASKRNAPPRETSSTPDVDAEATSGGSEPALESLGRKELFDRARDAGLGVKWSGPNATSREEILSMLKRSSADESPEDAAAEGA